MAEKHVSFFECGLAQVTIIAHRPPLALQSRDKKHHNLSTFSTQAERRALPGCVAKSQVKAQCDEFVEVLVVKKTAIIQNNICDMFWEACWPHGVSLTTVLICSGCAPDDGLGDHHVMTTSKPHQLRSVEPQEALELYKVSVDVGSVWQPSTTNKCRHAVLWCGLFPSIAYQK